MDISRSATLEAVSENFERSDLKHNNLKSQDKSQRVYRMSYYMCFKLFSLGYSIFKSLRYVNSELFFPFIIIGHSGQHSKVYRHKSSFISFVILFSN